MIHYPSQLPLVQYDSQMLNWVILLVVLQVLFMKSGEAVNDTAKDSLLMVRIDNPISLMDL